MTLWGFLNRLLSIAFGVFVMVDIWKGGDDHLILLVLCVLFAVRAKQEEKENQ